MRRILVAALMSAVVCGVSAIPVRRGLWKWITLNDGTEVRAEFRGDARACQWVDADGHAYVSADDGRYQPYTPSDEDVAAKSLLRRATIASSSDGLGRYGQPGMGAVSSIGACTLPVIMVQFPDCEFQPTTTVERVSRLLNEKDYADQGSVGSVADYFEAQSKGLFTPHFDVLGIVTLDRSYTYYGKDFSSNNIDSHLTEIVDDVLKAAADQLSIDFSAYSTGGEVPLVSFYYAGNSQALTSVSSDIWPVEFECDLNYDAFHFSDVMLCNELADGVFQGIGVFCHEFSHALGLPDFYLSSNTYSAFSDWSIMDNGCYVNGGYVPMGYTAYERSYMGWLDIPQLTDDGRVTLSPVEGVDGISAIVIRHPRKQNEYFIVEHRQPDVWYPVNYGSGLMVSRFAYDSYQWEYNSVNTSATTGMRAKVVPADTEMLRKSRAESKNLFGNEVKTISQLQFFDDITSDCLITDITANADGTISFNFSAGDAAGISGITADVADSALRHYRTLDGRDMGTDFGRLPRGIYVVKGRKVVKK